MMYRTGAGVFRVVGIFSCALIVFAAVMTLRAQEPVPASQGGPIIENERARIWDITLHPGEATPVKHHDLDFVTMYLTGGDVRITTADGKRTMATHNSGDAVFTKAGVDEQEEVVSKSPVRVIVVELKNHPEPMYENKTGFPAAFPRPRSEKTFENERVVCWRYTWNPGEKTPMHFHDKDIVVVYRYTGSLASTTPEGVVTGNDYVFGSVRFNRGNRAHYEELSKGQQSAMLLEFK